MQTNKYEETNTKKQANKSDEYGQRNQFEKSEKWKQYEEINEYKQTNMKTNLNQQIWTKEYKETNLNKQMWKSSWQTNMNQIDAKSESEVYTDPHIHNQLDEEDLSVPNNMRKWIW